MSRLDAVLKGISENKSYSEIGAEIGASRAAVSGILTRHVNGKSREADEYRLTACELIDAGLNDDEIYKRTRVPKAEVAELRALICGGAA